MVPMFDGEEADIKQAHIEKMIHCDAVLIYYGMPTVPGLI